MKLKKCNLVTGFLAAVLLLTLSASTVLATNPVQLVIGGSGATPWAISNIKPGDSGSEPITIMNSGSSAGTLTIWVSGIINTEGTPAEFEPNPGTIGELGNYITFSIVSSRVSSNIVMPVLINRLPQSAVDSNYIKVYSLAAGETVAINWNWSLPSGTGNIVQGDSLSFDINYLLEQIELPPTTTTTPPTQTSTTPQASSSTVPTQTTSAPPSTAPTTLPPTSSLPSTSTSPVTVTTQTPTTTAIPSTTTSAPPAGPISGGTAVIIFWLIGIELAICAVLLTYFFAGKPKKTK